jgi:cytosine/adenosine deaminase-related metal-dependent hydrolase
MDLYDYASIDDLKNKYVILGSIVHSLSLEVLEIIEDGMIIYSADTGMIERVINLKDRLHVVYSNFKIVYNYTGKLIIPGFIDAHCHAPQYIFSGIGIGIPRYIFILGHT